MVRFAARPAAASSSHLCPVCILLSDSLSSWPNTQLHTTHSQPQPPPCGPDASLCCLSRRGGWDVGDLNTSASTAGIFHPCVPPASVQNRQSPELKADFLLKPHPLSHVWMDKVKCQAALTAKRIASPSFYPMSVSRTFLCLVYALLRCSSSKPVPLVSLPES